MKGRILIIDDEKNICDVLSAYLDEHGFKSIGVNSLQEARLVLNGKVSPDAILLDVMLPDGNGIAYLKELRKSPGTRHIPVIVMSAVKHTLEDKVAGLESGADDYLLKPFDLKEMKLRLEGLLKRHFRAETSKSETFTAVVRNPKPSTIKPHDNLENTLSSFLKRERSEPPILAEKSAAPLSENKPIKKQKHWNDQITELLLWPREFFNSTFNPEKVEIAVLSCLTAAVGFGLQSGVQEKSFGVGVVSVLMFSLEFFAISGIVAWGIQWTMGLRGHPLPFKPLFSATGIGFVPVALASLLGALYVMVANGRTGDFTASPLLFLPSQIASPTFGLVLRRLDLFEFWGIVLTIFALSQVTKSRLKNVGVFAVGVWVAVVATIMVVQGFLK